MKKTQQYYNSLPECSIVDYELIPLPEAALLWCGVNFEDLADEVALLSNISQSIYSHPYIPCLEKKTRVINKAINEGKLRAVREHGEGGEVITDYLGRIEIDSKGNPKIDHVSYNRRHFWIKDLKTFISENYPNDRPKTIFYDEELKPPVSSEENLMLQAKINELQTKLSNAESQIRDCDLKIDTLSIQVQQAKTAQTDAEERLEKGREHYRQLQKNYNQLKINADSKLTLDNALYLLGEVINAVKSKNKQWTQSGIIDEILTQRQEKQVIGLEQRTIEEYFSNANKRFKAK